MILSVILLIVGIALLIFSSNYLIQGASSLAKRLGVSTLIIGLSIVALGTSLPELFFSIFALLQNNSELILGNIIGSNMSNTLLVLGILALLTTINVSNNTVYKEIPFSFLAVFLLLIFTLSMYLDKFTQIAIIGRTQGIILLLFFAFFLYYLFTLIKTDKKSSKELIGEEPEKYSLWVT